MCAVAVLEAKFVNIADRSPVDVSKIPLQRFRLVSNCFWLSKLEEWLQHLLLLNSCICYSAKGIRAKLNRSDDNTKGG